MAAARSTTRRIASAVGACWQAMRCGNPSPASRLLPLSGRRPRFFLTLVLSGALACGADEAKVTATKVGPPQGKLLVVGGGTMGPLWDVFIELAGGKDAVFVVIPTANEPVAAVDRTIETLKARGVTRVTQLHTRDPKV